MATFLPCLESSPTAGALGREKIALLQITILVLQRALNSLNPGTRIDEQTISALAAFVAKRRPHGEAVLLKALEALQGERYLDLAERRSADETFL